MPEDEMERIVGRAVGNVLRSLSDLVPSIVGHSLVRRTDARNRGRFALLLEYEDRDALTIASVKGHEDLIRREVLAAVKDVGCVLRPYNVVFLAKKEAELEAMVRVAMWRVRRSLSCLSPPIVNHIYFGAGNPDLLSIYLAYTDRAALKEAREKGHPDLIRAEILAALMDVGYPGEPNEVRFISEEEVNEQGGPWKYFR